MSQIVMLRTCLAAPQTMSGLLASLATRAPQFVEAFQNLEMRPIIEECAQNALAHLAALLGIGVTKHVSDYGGRVITTFNGLNIIGSLRTQNLPGGLGIVVDQQGNIQFVTDDYKDQWKKEITRLRSLFETAFSAEAGMAIARILGYKDIACGRSIVEFNGQEKLVVTITGRKL